jgi:Domain of unknown function (DUF4167)
MRSSKSRSRSKSNRPRPMGNVVNRVFDSSGPEGKVRGTPQQIIDKYLILARDAQLSNDRVAAENFLQHAEHYTRMLGEAQRELQREAESRRDGQQDNFRDRPNQNQRRDNQQDGGQDNDPQPDLPDFVTAPRAPAPQQQPEMALGATDVIDLDEGEESSLVETPESRPAPQPSVVTDTAPEEAATSRAPRQPRQRQRSDNRPPREDGEAQPAAAAQEQAEPATPRPAQRRRSAPRKPKAADGDTPARGETSSAE